MIPWCGRGEEEESLKGTQYPSRRTHTTQDSAPIARHHLQCSARQPPTLKGRDTPTGCHLSSPSSLTPGVAGALQRKRKREPNPSEQGEGHQRYTPAPNQRPKTQQTQHQPKPSEKSLVGEGCVEQVRRWQPHASWAKQSLGGNLVAIARDRQEP